MPRRSSRREAVRVARGVAALEADLMGPLAVELDEEVGVDGQGAVVVELDHPAVDALGVELRIPARVQRVREVDALAVATHLDHLRAAGELARRRVAGTPDDPAEVNRAGLLRVVRVGDVVALELAGAPAGD